MVFWRTRWVSERPSRQLHCSPTFTKSRYVRPIDWHLALVVLIICASDLHRQRVAGPFLIIVPLTTLSNWALEFQKWCVGLDLTPAPAPTPAHHAFLRAPCLDVIIYRGNPTYRKSLRNDILANKFNVLLTTYEFILKDKGELALARDEPCDPSHGASFH